MSNTKKFTVEVNNVSATSEEYNYILVTVTEDGELWYYGADNDYDRRVEIQKNLAEYGRRTIIIQNK